MTSPEELPRFLASERRVELLMMSALRTATSRRFVIHDVTVIPRFDEPAISGVDVIVDDGRIETIGSAVTSAPAHRIDGAGRWLVGGLVDAHVHTQQSARQDALHLLHGVTGVREMCGFSWMPSVRDAVSAGARLAPRMMVAGHILADHPLDGYATVVTSVEDVRRRIREQAAGGVDAIKVHNRLVRPLYDEVVRVAEASQLPLVGHIPHHISVTDAVRAGQVTFEHLKGYYNDWDLNLATDDWVGATRDAEVWNCPTLVTSREGSRGEEARRRLRTRAASLMDPRLLARWMPLVEADPNRALDLILERSRFVIDALRSVTDRWLTGTDSGGGIAFLVPGEAMHEEMALMEQAGIPRNQVLHASTHALGECHPNSGFPTRIAAGQPADLLVLDADPRDSTDAYRHPLGVSVGGRWLDRDQLDAIESGLRTIDRDALTDDDVGDLVAETADSSPNGWHRALAEGLLGRERSVAGPLPDEWP